MVVFGLMQRNRNATGVQVSLGRVNDSCKGWQKLPWKAPTIEWRAATGCAGDVQQCQVSALSKDGTTVVEDRERPWKGSICSWNGYLIGLVLLDVFRWRPQRRTTALNTPWWVEM